MSSDDKKGPPPPPPPPVAIHTGLPTATSDGQQISTDLPLGAPGNNLDLGQGPTTGRFPPGRTTGPPSGIGPVSTTGPPSGTGPPSATGTLPPTGPTQSESGPPQPPYGVYNNGGYSWPSQDPVFGNYGTCSPAPGTGAGISGMSNFSSDPRSPPPISAYRGTNSNSCASAPVMGTSTGNFYQNQNQNNSNGGDWSGKCIIYISTVK